MQITVLLTLLTLMACVQLATLALLLRARGREARAHDLARIDPLTGIGNRRALDEDLQAAGQRGTHTCPRGAVIMLDVDRFKQLNDDLGHLWGDNILQTIAAALLAQTRTEVDGVYRYGGDEFVVVLPNISIEQAHRIGHRIATDIDQRVAGLDAGLGSGLGLGRRVTCSWGATSLGTARSNRSGPAPRGRSWTAALAEADRRMYANKALAHLPSPP